MKKRNYNVKYIKKLLNQSSEEIVNSENILSEQKSLYRNLYSSRQNNIDSSYKHILSDDTLLRLNDSEHEELKKDLQIEEIAKAFKEFPNDKTPGSDDFTSNFFKFFWPDLKELLYGSFQYSFQNGVLSADQRQGVITYIPKEGKDLTFLTSWHPVSILNTDYKILRKTLANRLQRVNKSRASRVCQKQIYRSKH